MEYLREAIRIADGWMANRAARDLFAICRSWKIYLCGELLINALLARQPKALRNAASAASSLPWWWIFQYVHMRMAAKRASGATTGNHGLEQLPTR